MVRNVLFDKKTVYIDNTTKQTSFRTLIQTSTFSRLRINETSKFES